MLTMKKKAFFYFIGVSVDESNRVFPKHELFEKKIVLVRIIFYFVSLEKLHSSFESLLPLSHTVRELLPILRVYSDGTIERLGGSPYVFPTPNDPLTGVSSKDISITPNVSVRLYLPKFTSTDQSTKLPILVYFRRGFCAGSAFSSDNHRYLNLLVSKAQVIAVSVDYRIAPEYPLPTAYEDSWTALQWVSSHKNNIYKDPWLIEYSDFDRIYIGGDTTGANIAHNLAMRAGTESLHGNVKILGVFLSQPYFWGSKPIRSELSTNHQENMICQTWMFVYPSAPGGMDNQMVNPFAEGAPSLSGLGCSRLLVCVGEKDITKDRGIHYCDKLRESGWRGEVELYIAEGGESSFHIRNPETKTSQNMIQRLTAFLK